MSTTWRKTWEGTLGFFENEGGFCSPDTYVGEICLEKFLMELCGIDGGSRGWVIPDNFEPLKVKITIELAEEL